MDKKILIVAKREYLERVRTRWFVIMTLLVPALIAGFVMLTAYIGSRGNASNAVRHITIIDATGADLGERVANALIADTTLGPIADDSIRPRVVERRRRPISRRREQQVAAEVQIAESHRRLPRAHRQHDRRKVARATPDAMRRASRTSTSCSRPCGRRSR